MSNKSKKAFRLPGPSGLVLVIAFGAIALLPLMAASVSSVEPAAISAEFAAALGLLAGALVFLQFVSSGRFERISGKIGIDRTMGFHRMAAMFLIVAAILHPISYIAPTLFVDPAAAGDRLFSMLTSVRLSTGIAALALLVVIVVLAIWRTRLPFRYEVWRVAHGPLGAAAALLIVHHAVSVGSYSGETIVRAAWGILGLIAVLSATLVYVIRPMQMRSGDWKLESIRQSTKDIVELTIRGSSTKDFLFRGGQFVWLTMAPHRPPFHDHPFSIASGPAELPIVRFIVREAGDCTIGFRNLRPGTPVAVDGPHGSFVLPAEAESVLMIAGGVGIAPILGMLEEAASAADARQFRLLYAAHDSESLAARERLEELRTRLDLHVFYHVDETEFGSQIMKSSDIDQLMSGISPRTAAGMVCGPPSMMEMVTDALLKIGVPSNAIHYERFDYAAGKGRLDQKRRRQGLATFAVLVLAIFAFAFR